MNNDLNTLIESQEDPIYICNEDDNVVYQNKAAKKLWPNSLNVVCYKRFHHLSTPCSWCPRLDRKGSGQVTILPLNRIFQIKAQTLESGNTAFLMREITQEQRLLNSLIDLRKILDTMVDVTIIFGMDGTITFANKEAENLLSPSGGLIGEDILQLIDPVEHIHVSRIIREIFSKEYIQFESVLLDANSV